jgi:hypothetical protein
MDNFSEWTDDSYNKILQNYKSEDYFDEVKIVINYTKNISAQPDERQYKIISLQISEHNEGNDYFNELKNFIEKFNKVLIEDRVPDNWQLFYVYKELFQFCISKAKKGSCNYFRGQSHHYDLVPGILRKNVQNSYRKEFESLYLKIANEFPDKVSYFNFKSADSIEQREYQLSLLQHYGLKTSLLDITKNPYIAMLFMLSEQFNEYKEPTIYLFNIDEQIHRKKHLFTEVKKSKKNERIIAQQGAFLNFDKIFNNKSFDIEKIICTKIVLHFSENSYIKYLDEEKENLSNIQQLDDFDKVSYEEFLDTEKNQIQNSKFNCLKFIKDELTQKLREYYYFEEDLFPDFEKRIQYLSEKYESNGQEKKISS